MYDKTNGKEIGEYATKLCLGNTSDCSVAVDTDDYSSAANTGNCSIAANTGDNSDAINAGDCSIAANTGCYSDATGTGYRSAALNMGNHSAASVTGEYSVAIALGVESKAKGALGSYIVLAEWKPNGKHYQLVDFKVHKVDGETIKPDTFYMLRDGKFIEAEESHEKSGMASDAD